MTKGALDQSPADSSFRVTKTVLAWFLVIATFHASAGGLRGLIKSDDGKPLPFATIYVKQSGTGVVSDQQGRFEIVLSPGTYDFYFQFLGYETEVRRAEIGADFLEVEITLKSQVMVLPSFTVRADQEDPAYTVMRKAISKANYHIQQIDAYTAKVYLKGKGKLTDYPWLAKKALEKEGITKDRLFISESVSEIKYRRPNKFEERVIAVYSNGSDRNTSPNQYVFGSFYQPEIAEVISPLSPKAFSYYRFEYLGTFKDQNYDITKIKVVPRSRGDNVFDGVIYIVEDWWSIHSLDFNVTKLGIKFQVKQIYNAIEDKAWLPVSQQFKVDGRVFGFEFVYDYLATVKDYKITLNPALPLELTVIDEKIEKEKAKDLNSKFSQKGQQLQKRLEEGKEVTNKELKQLVKEYEKEERKKEKEPDVLSDTRYEVDSMAYKKDSTYWTEMRPAPLEKEEIRGYKVNDSISQVQRKREEGDSLKPSKNKGFQVWDVFTGDNYGVGKNANFQIHTPWGGYNTVEGWNLIYRVGLTKRWIHRDSSDLDKRPIVKRLEITPVARYAFSREVFSGYLRADYRAPHTRLTIEGGKYVQQYNRDNPIHPLINTFTTLFLADNLMKLYERNFVDVNWRQRLDDKFTITANLSWSHRSELFNNSNTTFFGANEDRFTPNAPVSLELANTSFAPNNAFIGQFGFEARPWQKYRIRNGFKYRADNTSPLFTAWYRKGFSSTFGSDVDFDQIEITARHGVRLGVRGKLDFALKGGMFLNTRKMYFMDYQHFLGNRTPFVTTDPVGSFRLMDYYLYSTNDKYFAGNAHYHFRKFLLTTIPYVRLAGVTENIFVNYLAAPTSGNFTEVGYGIEGILRLFRLEAAAAFRNGSYQTYGFRIGIATSLTVNFD